jgi:hypothetical protein
MSGSNILKIERVSVPGNDSVWVDLCLDKKKGVFWARVGNVDVREGTKEEAVKKTKEALSKLSNVQWRQVIVISVSKAERNEGGVTRRSGIGQHHACCSVSYERVERSTNPTRKNEQIERLHAADFEDQIKEERERAAGWEFDRLKKKVRADEQEAKFRQARSTLADSREVWEHGAETMIKYEIPYSDEAWAGIERIAETLRAMQKRLDEFAAEWTTESLAALGSGTDTLFLRAAPKPRRGGDDG